MSLVKRKTPETLPKFHEIYMSVKEAAELSGINRITLLTRKAGTSHLRQFQFNNKNYFLRAEFVAFETKRREIAERSAK